MKKIGIIGCGNMGTALLRGILAGKLAPASRVICSDADAAKARRVARALRVAPAGSNAELAARSEVVLLAVKPQQMEKVLEEIHASMGKWTLVISIAAGIRTGWIEKRVGSSVPVVRAMPNTPALVGAGISAIAPGRRAGAAHLKQAERILGAAGEVVRVPERWMDAVTAVSGSGPAYFFYLMEQMIAAGVELGLEAKTARRLTLATAAGASALAAGAEAPAALRAKVTSKGGTTEAAFRAFERGRLARTLRAGIRAAAKRSKELSR